ncbi:MAG: SCO3242 family prenyltransferase [Catenulispora sp.]
MSRRNDLRTLAELVRAPAALSVPGDVIAGAAAAGWPFGRRRTAGLAASSVLLYWAGMALNDYADREIDAKERPHRPIPSGRIAPRTALRIAGGLTAAGLLGATAAGGRRALATSAPLAAGIWAYDLVFKGTPAGAASMALARAMNVLAGAGPGGLRAAGPAAAVTAAHTMTLMALSAKEVDGSDPGLPAVTMAATAAVGTAAALLPGRSRRVPDRAAAAAMAAGYVGLFGKAQAKAVAKPSAKNLQKAVGAGIMSLIPLQAALAAKSGALRAGAPLLAALPIGRALAKKVATT